MESRDFEWVIKAHTQYPRKPKMATRKWDGKTPYHIHPSWCATTLLTETSLPEDLRQDGALALLYHDVLEDTNLGLPPWLSARVHSLILDMTFYGGSQEEMEKIWGKSSEVKLLKLYDKVSNLMDGAWMSAEKREEYVKYTLRLCKDVEDHFGAGLTITKIAKAIL